MMQPPRSVLGVARQAARQVVLRGESNWGRVGRAACRIILATSPPSPRRGIVRHGGTGPALASLTRGPAGCNGAI